MTKAMRQYNFKELELYKYNSVNEKSMAYQDSGCYTTKAKDRSFDKLVVNDMPNRRYEQT